MRKFLLALIFWSTFSYGQAVDLVATPSTGQAPLPVALTWTSTGVDACVKDGVSVPVAGSQNLTVNATTTYSIACTGGKNYSDISWTAPTQNTDGSTIPATGVGSLGGFRLYYSTNPATVETATPINLTKDLRTYRIVGQPNAVYYYKMTAYNTENVSSAFTGAVNNTINFVQVADTAPVTITAAATFSTTAPGVYNLVKKANGFILVYVGIVPLNTLCDITQTVNGYYAVPVSLVTWSGTVKPIVVVAQCSLH